ncbi:hypothetical protein H1R20_g11843, partial [Candolleomyces eurysporus]
MASNKPINVGIIGLSTKGWGAVAHSPALAHPSLRSTWNITALQTSSAESAAAAKEIHDKTWSGIRAYHGEDATALSQDSDVDVVTISVKAPLHKAAFDKAVAAGKDIFVEYPPGRSLEESLEMRRQVQEKGNIRVVVGLQGRQNATMRKVKQIIDAGKIGKIRSTTVVASVPREARFWQPQITEDVLYLLDKANGATMLNICGGHHLDTLMYLLGPFVSVSATASTQYPETSVLSKTTNEVIRTLPSNVPDHYTFSGPLKSGAHATVVWRSTYPTTPGRTQLLWIIDGETGSIKFESPDLGPLPTGLVNMFNPIATVNGQPLDEYLKAEGIEYSDPQLELNDGEKGGFIEFVRRSWIEYGKSLQGGQGEFATLDDAIEVQRVVDAIERSAERGGVAITLN